MSEDNQGSLNLNSSSLKRMVEEYVDQKIEKNLREAGEWHDESEAKYVIYARKSTTDEERQERSIDDQIADCQKICQDRGIEPLKIFKESKSAKISRKRPLFQEMIDGIRDGKWNSIVTWHPNRLARNMLEAGEIIDLLSRGDIQNLIFKNYMFQHRNNDNSINPNALMMLGIEFIMAKQYSDNLSEAVNRGSIGIAKEGRIPSKTPRRGYLINEKGYSIPDGNNFGLLQDCLYKIAEGELNTKGACQFLNDNHFQYQGKECRMTKQKISEICADPFICGFYIYGKQTKVDMSQADPDFMPLIPYGYFLKIRERFEPARRKLASKKDQSVILFRNMIYCGYEKDGRTEKALMTPAISTGSSGKKDYLYIVCTNPYCHCKEELGKKQRIRGHIIIDYLRDFLKGIELREDAYNLYVQGGEKEIKRRLTEIRNKVMNTQRLIKEVDSEIKDKSKILVRAEGKLIDQTNTEISGLFERQQELKQSIVKLKQDEKEIEIGRDSNRWTREEFLNNMKNIGNIAKNYTNEEPLDEIIRLVFLNLTIKDRKVVDYQLNTLFEKLMKPSSVLRCRSDRTRTCGLCVPNTAL